MIDELTIYNLSAKYPNTVDLIREVEKMARADTINEFANKLKKELNNYDFWKYDIVVDGYVEEKEVSYDWIIDEIAKMLNDGNDYKRSVDYIHLEDHAWNDVALFTFDMNDNNCDLKMVADFIKMADRVIPKETALIILPDLINMKTIDKDSLRYFIDKAEEIYKEINEND